jgi:putative heme-binding domain-containing protein
LSRISSGTEFEDGYVRSFPFVDLTKLLFLAACLVATPAFAQRDLKDIPNPDPEEERKSFVVAEGFEVNLYAADPLLAKPIQMNFDPDGRLWVASSEVYPQIQPGQEQTDRVLVLEDTNGDGQADKTTVFVGGLLIPTGVEPGDGGAYVANSTELVHFKDEDGDGKADSKTVMLSGFGTEDTHHIIHTFRWGPDMALYFNQSIYIHSHVETPWGVRRLGGGGIWRFAPDSRKLEVLCRGFVNTWGHHFDDYGNSFATDGAYIEGINYVFPGSVFFTAPNATRILKGYNPGSPKHCGLERVTGTHLPEDWRGDLITNDFRGHRVCRFKIGDSGSGFVSREQPEVIKTNHAAFRPIDVKMGPDGAIYIADWYNPIIQHGEVDFRDPRRDKTHGRIWRVTAKGRPLVKFPALRKMPTSALLDLLKSPEQFTRQQVKRVLKERGADQVLPELNVWLSRLSKSTGDKFDPAVEHQRLEALWVARSFEAPLVAEPANEVTILPGNLLLSKSPGVRAAAMRSAADNGVRDVKWYEARVVDENPRVRLEAIRALALIGTLDAAKAAMIVVDKPLDDALDFGAWQTARDLQNVWLPEALAGRFDFGEPRRLVFALQAIGSPEVVPLLVSLYEAGKIPADREAAALGMIGSLGGPKQLRVVLDLALKQADVPGDRAATLIGQLIEAAEKRKTLPEGDLAPSAQLLKSQSASVRIAAARAIGLWKVEGARPALVELASAEGTEPGLRNAALAGLVALGGEATKQTLVALASDPHPRNLRGVALASLASADPVTAAGPAVAWLASYQPGDNLGPVFDAFVKQKDGPAALAAALKDKKLPADAGKIGLRQAKVSGRDLPDLNAALTAAAGIGAGPRVLSPEEMARLVAAVKTTGDAARGEQVFRRAELACLKCHGISGAGGQVGPDMTSIGASAQVDYLIDSMFQPDKQVKEGFHSVVVETDEGKVVNGIQVRKTDDELVLRDAEDREIAIPLKSIAEQAVGKSLMPAGLVDALTEPELIDLVRFLSELGKVGPYAPSQARLARSWQAWTPNDEARKQRFDGVSPRVFLADQRFAWSAAYTRVSGELPVFEQPWQHTMLMSKVLTLVRTKVVVKQPGKVRFGVKLSGAAKWTTIVDGKEPFFADITTPTLDADLPVGTHWLVIAIERENPSQTLRVELLDAPGSPAQAEWAVGK